MSALCGARYPAQGGVYCTRDGAHQGGHLNRASGIYWPDRPPAADLAERERRQADRRQRLAEATGGPSCGS